MADYKELGNDPNVGAVFLVTPEQVHKEMVVAFPEAGGEMPVSPMKGAFTVAVCNAIVESAKTGKPLQIKYPQI